MKLLILAAGPTQSVDTSSHEIPKCLRSFDDHTTILDRIIAAGTAAGCDQVAIIGGYRILAIMEQYPRLKYYYNPNWERTGSLASLLQGLPEFTDDLLIVYSDVVFEPQRTAALTSASGDLIVATDSRWTTRYEGRTAQIQEEAEKLYRSDAHRLRVTRDTLSAPWRLLGEFAGAFVLRQSVLSRAQSFAQSIVASDPGSGVDQLITALSAELEPAAGQIVDFEGAWAELDSEQDLVRFRFGTKAETLQRLQGYVTSATVLPQLAFSVAAWREDSAGICAAVQKAFPGAAVVVRSSALNEDTEHASLAGSYTSVLDVPTDDTSAIATAVEAVCQSYIGSGEEEQDNQVLVQPMVENVHISGVAFTADLESRAPYYIINYDTSGSTESVTAGERGAHQTVVLHKHSDVVPSDPAVRAVVTALREVELQTGYSNVDVEFAVTEDGEVIIFQVRPIAAHKDQLRVSATDVSRELASVTAFIRAHQGVAPPLAGSRSIWGIMPDWNPAEIIGINPAPLAFTLYRYVITDEIWGRSRQECGYRATRPWPGIVSFAGKPYVDVRMSFSSFTPAALPDSLAHRLVDAALAHLQDHRELHDKVEFAVMPTAYDLDFAVRLRPLLAYDHFTSEERDTITAAYRDLTVRIIRGESLSVDREMERIAALSPQREQVLHALQLGEMTVPGAIAALLDQCREYGTLPFSNLARFAFIGMSQLRSLVARNVLTPTRMEAFLASIETVAKEFIHDLATASREDLITRYGHLRPGTYDITSPAYHEAFDQYVDIANRPPEEPLVSFTLIPVEEEMINNALTEAEFGDVPLTAQELFTFIRAAVQGRERGKFEFTRTLSVVIDLIVHLTAEEGLTREEARFLTIQDILACSGVSKPPELAREWRTRAEERRRHHRVTQALRLPPVITNEAEVQCFTIRDEKPNFITRTIIQGQPHRVHGIDTAIEGQIVLIENADPGFDWVFSHNIAGLVTQFGGANSHMAIRCAEFEIPAAIGCGEAIFSRLERAHLVRMDCSNQTIEVIR